MTRVHNWLMRYRDAKRNGIRRLFPRLEVRGIDAADRRKLIRRYQYVSRFSRCSYYAPARGVLQNWRVLIAQAGTTAGSCITRLLYKAPGMLRGS